MVWRMCGWIAFAASMSGGYTEQYADPYSIPLENIRLSGSFPNACSSNLAGLIKCLKMQRMQYGAGQDGGLQMGGRPGHGMHSHAARPHGRRHKMRGRRSRPVMNVFELLSGLLPSNRSGDPRQEAKYLKRKHGCKKDSDYIDTIFRKIIDNQEDLLPENVQVSPYNVRPPRRAGGAVRRGRPRAPYFEQEETSDPNKGPASGMPGMAAPATYPSYNGQYMPQQNNTAQPYQNTAYASSGYTPAEYSTTYGSTGGPGTSGGTLSYAGQNSTGYGYTGQAAQANAGQATPANAVQSMPPSIQQPQPAQTTYPAPSLYTAPSLPALSATPSLPALSATPCVAPACGAEESSSESEDTGKPVASKRRSKRVEIRCMCRNENGTLKSCKCKKS